MRLRAFAYESVTIDDTAGGVGLTAATYAVAAKDMAREAFLTLETAQIRWTINGTAPTALVGHLLEVGQTLTLKDQSEIANFKGFRTGGTSGVLKVTYFRLE